MTTAWGENPWDVQQRQQERDQADWFRKSQDTLDKAALDPESFFAGKELSFARTPQQAYKIATTDAFLALHTAGPLPSDDLSRKLLRAQLADTLFQGRGAESDDALHTEIVADATRRKSSKEITTNLLTDAIASSLVRTTDPAGDAKNPKTFAAWKATAAQAPGYDANKQADYYEAWTGARRAADEARVQFQKPLNDVWKAFKDSSLPGVATGILSDLLPDGGISDGAPSTTAAAIQRDSVATVARDAYFQIPEKDRPRFMASLKLLAGTLPKEEQTAFWTNLNKQAGRDIGGFAQSTQDLGTYFAGLAGDSFFTPETQQEKDRLRAMGNPIYDGQEARASIDFAAEVKRIQESTYDPMKYLAAEGSWSQILEKGVYGAPGAIATSAVAAIPGVGMGIFYASSQEQIYQQYRQDFQDKGMDYQQASDMANNLAPIATVPQVLMEKLNLEPFVGKLPFLDKALTELTDKITSRAARFGVRTVAGTIEEGFLEKSQDLVPAAIQAIGHALENDIPDVQWTGKGGALDGYWADTLSMFVTMLPLSMLGAAGGFSADARVKAFANATDNEILAVGVHPDDLANIRDGIAKGVGSGTAAIDASFSRLDPRSDSAMTAVQSLAEDQILQREAQLSGVLPILTRNASGWTVTDGQTGETIGTAPTSGDAWRLAKTHSAAMDDLGADHVAYMASMMEAADAVAKLDQGGNQTTTRLDLSREVTEMDIASRSAEAMARYVKQVAMREAMRSGSSSITYGVLGESHTDFIENQRKTTNQLYLGASITDVFHEGFHGFRREARAAGRITRADDIALLRSLDTIFAGKTTKRDADGNVEQLRFLPEGIADKDIDEDMIDEAMSHVGELEILRSRTDRSGKKQLAPSGIITRNLTAIGKIVGSKTANNFKAFMDAIRAHFGLSMSRALALKKAEREGKFDRAGYDAYLAKLLGTTEQDQHNQEVAKQAADLLGTDYSGENVDAMEEGDPFSIGRASFTTESLDQALFDKIGEDALRLEQPRASYDDKRQLLLDFAQSIVGDEKSAPAKPPGNPDNQGDLLGRRGGLGDIQIIRQYLAEDLATDLQVRFIGETIGSPEALAVKAQALRNPRFETFYLLAAKSRNKRHKGGQGFKIVDAMALTSRVPSSAAIFAEGKSWDDGIADHVAFLQSAEADFYFLLHNHPSGDPSPSAADVSITVRHAAEMKKHGITLANHVVINHKTFTHIDSAGNANTNTIPEYALREEGREWDPYAWPSRLIDKVEDIGQMASSPMELAELAKKIETDRSNPNHILGFITNARMRVVSTFSAPPHKILTLSKETLASYTLSQGGTYLSLHANASTPQEASRLVENLKPLNEQGILFDLVVNYTDENSRPRYMSGRTEGVFRNPGAFYGLEKGITGTRIQEQANYNLKSYATQGGMLDQSFSVGPVMLPPTTKKSRTLSDPALAPHVGGESGLMSFDTRAIPTLVGNEEDATSFSLGRARENFFAAQNRLLTAKEALTKEEKDASTARYQWEIQHGKQTVDQYPRSPKGPLSNVLIAGNKYNRPRTNFGDPDLEAWRKHLSLPEESTPQEVVNAVTQKVGREIFGFAGSSGDRRSIRLVSQSGQLIAEIPGTSYQPFPEPESLIAAREALAQAEADLYLAEEEFDPETDARLAIADRLREKELAKKAAMFAALLDARDDETRNAASYFVAKVWAAYGSHDKVFQYGKTESSDADDIAAAVSTPGKLVTATESGDSVRFSGPSGHLTIHDADTDRPHIEALAAGSKGKKAGGGSQLYAAALDWIHNNGKRIKDDPGGLTAINHVRRTSNFLASAIRWGTTKHLMPHKSQAVGKWTKNDVLNTALLATKELDNVLKLIPSARALRFDFQSGSFFAGERLLTDADLEGEISNHNAGDQGVGISTLQRAIITASAIQEFQRGTASSALESAESGLPDSLTGVSYSLAPSERNALLMGDALSRVKDPIRRAQAMAKISKNFNELRLAAERVELIAGSKRLRKSLQKEAAMREAQRADELERDAYARHYGILSTDDLTTLKSRPLHELLSVPKKDGTVDHLHGRLMSKAAAIKAHPDLFQLHRSGSYDGADGVARTVFGGSLTPDQAAQEAYDAHLISEPTPDALWDELKKEQASVATMKEAMAKAEADIKAARTTAREETNAWLKTQTETIATAYSPKQEILRALASLDAILTAIPADVRGRIGGYTALASLGSEETRLQFLQDKLAKADKELEGWMRRQYDAEFRKLLDSARPLKKEAGEKPRGKIGADIHDLFRSVEDSMTMKAHEVEAEVERLDNLANHVNTTPEQQAHLLQEAGLVALAGNWQKADAARREQALLEATRIYSIGYGAFQRMLSAKREARAKSRDALRADTGKGGERMERLDQEIKDSKTKIGRAKQVLLSLYSFEQVLHKAFGEDSKVGKMLADWELRASEAKHDNIHAKMDGLDELFADLAQGKYKGEQLRWDLAQPGSVTVTDFKGRTQTFSQLEAITATLMWKQEDGKRHMEGYFDEETNTPNGEWHWRQQDIDAIEAQLSSTAKAVRLHLTEEYATEYDRLNSVFQSLYGVNLPRHKFYSPLTVAPSAAAAGQTLDPVTGSTMSGASLTPGSLRTRSQTAIAEPRFADALQTFIAHTKQMEHWMAYTPFATEAMNLLNNREVGNSIEASAGKEAKNVIRAWIDHFAQGGSRDAAAHLAVNGWLGRMLGRATQAALVGRMSVLGIQSLQLGAAAYEMPIGAFAPRFAKLLAGQLGWKAAIQSDYIQRRLADMPPLVRQALEGLASAKPSRLKYLTLKMGETINGADALFTAGTYAILFDYHLTEATKQGLTGKAAEDYAHEAAVRGTDRVAQPIRPGARSLYELTATGPSARMIWAFASEARQKAAITAYALAEKPTAEKLKAVAITWAVSGGMASILRAIMRDLRDDGDDLFDERNWDPRKLALQTLTGPLQGIPILGKEIESGINAAFGQWQTDGSLLSTGKQLAQRVPKMAKDISTGDIDNLLKDAELILTFGAPGSENVASAASWSHVVRDLVNLVKNAAN
jgi:hypothetical protein